MAVGCRSRGTDSASSHGSWAACRPGGVSCQSVTTGVHILQQPSAHPSLRHLRLSARHTLGLLSWPEHWSQQRITACGACAGQPDRPRSIQVSAHEPLPWQDLFLHHFAHDPSPTRDVVVYGRTSKPIVSMQEKGFQLGPLDLNLGLPLKTPQLLCSRNLFCSTLCEPVWYSYLIGLTQLSSSNRTYWVPPDADCIQIAASWGNWGLSPVLVMPGHRGQPGGSGQSWVSSVRLTGRALQPLESSSHREVWQGPPSWGLPRGAMIEVWKVRERRSRRVAGMQLTAVCNGSAAWMAAGGAVSAAPALSMKAEQSMKTTT